jgi:hypothetical protein
MAENEIRMSGGGKTFRRGMETSGALPALSRIHGAGGFAVPSLGIKIMGCWCFMAIVILTSDNDPTFNWPPFKLSGE